MILLMDNYDSFSYNLYQLLGELEEKLTVVRNDRITIEEIDRMQPDAIVFSPGPGRPSEAGIMTETIRRFCGSIPMLGICLGHQAICEAFGGTIGYAAKLMHGKQSMVFLEPDCPLFQGCPSAVPVARYHSLAANQETLPSVLRVTARTEEGEIMAVQHRTAAVYGVQFHPESILTPDGRTMLNNFLKEVHHD